MVNADDYYGNYLKGEDITQEIPVTISKVEPETVEGEEKLVVYFHEFKKAMTLNKTNKDRLKAKFGTSDTDMWIGEKVTLTTETAYNPSQKKDAPAVRIKEEPAKPPAKEQPPKKDETAANPKTSETVLKAIEAAV